MAFLRTIVPITTTSTAAIPALASSSLSQTPKFQNLNFSSYSSQIVITTKSLSVARNLTRTLAAVKMDAPSSDHSSSGQNDGALPELLTEYMVDMKCEGCVNSVKDKLQAVEGINNIDVDLSNQVVRILGTTPLKTMNEALEQTGQKARLIGQGLPQDFLVSAAVAEFKGPDICGVARLAQVNMELTRIEANFSGLSPGKHGWSINEYGDLTNGPASTGKIFDLTSQGSVGKPLGDLGMLDVNEKGEASYSGVKEKLRVSDLIGRSILIYGTEDKSDAGLKAAVIARSAGVGENYKKICACDGTTIWEAGEQQ